MKVTNDGIVPPWLQPIDVWPLPTDPDYPHALEDITPNPFIPDDRYNEEDTDEVVDVQGTRS